MGQRPAAVRAGDRNGCVSVVVPGANGAVGEESGRASPDGATRESGYRAAPRTGGSVTMFTLQLDAAVPMLCVTLGALAAMAGEALRGKGPRMPVGWFGIIGLAGAAVSAVMLWNPTPEAYREDFGVIVADNFGLFVTLVLAVVGILTIMFSSQVIHRDNLPA